MTVKNISSKIINIGPTTLMPDDEMIVDAKTAKAPSLLALESMKLIAIADESAKTVTSAKAKKAKGEPAAEKAETEIKT